MDEREERERIKRVVEDSVQSARRRAEARALYEANQKVIGELLQQVESGAAGAAVTETPACAVPPVSSVEGKGPGCHFVFVSQVMMPTVFLGRSLPVMVF